jgi:hypothetical protein
LKATTELFSVEELGQVSNVQIPVLAIAITFAIFMTVILVAYFTMVRLEKKKERKIRSGYYTSEKNSYTEKLNFLENQEISASTL